MWALVKRERHVFFSTPVGYLTLAFFLTLSTLFLWFLDTDFNILNSGFADLNSFFVLSPWLLMFLIPALCMRSFSEEKRLGTLELLLTKPLSLWQIVLVSQFMAQKNRLNAVNLFIVLLFGLSYLLNF